MRTLVITSIAVFVLAASAGDAAAQILRLPPRSTQGLFGGARTADPNRVTHELSMTFSLLGGYEDNLSPQGGVPTDPLAPRQSGTNGIVSATARYRFGKATRYVEVAAGGFMNSFRNLDVRAMYGGDVGVNASTTLGEKAGLMVRASAEYTPSFQLGTVPSSGVLDPVPSPDPTGGVSEMRSTSADAVSNLTYDWSARHHSQVGYIYTRNRVRSSVGLDTVASVANLRQTWDLTRTFSFVGTYQFAAQATIEESGNRRPVDSHQGQVGFQWLKPVSRTRRLVFSGGAGAVHVQTFTVVENLPIDYVAPSVFGGARLDLGRTWAVSLDVRRDVTVLEGLTQQSFLTNSGAVWLGGNIGRSWSVAMTGTYSQGRPHEGEIGSYDSLSGTAQLQYMLARCCALVSSYSYYEHHLRDVSMIPAGFPNRFTRNVVSVGFTLWLPLYGSFAGGAPTATGRN